MSDLKNKLFTYTGLLLAVLVLVLAGYLFISSETASSTVDADEVLGDDGSVDYSDFTRIMRGKINSGPSDEVYGDFKELLEDFNFSTRHTAAHIFGGLLFQEKGLDSLPTCDASFGFGCYHGFFGEALADLGSSSISEMDKVCVDKYGPLGTGCQHGIGHGVLEYFGSDKLIKALNSCGASTQVNELFGCTSGVFMEYFLPVKITATTTTSEVRDYTSSDPYGPCDDRVPDEFKKSCYYEIGRWWGHVLDADYLQMGELCSDLSNVEYRESCFLGVGHISAIYTQIDLNDTISACNTMPSIKGETLCKAGASWTFFAQADKPQEASDICESLPREHRQECVMRSDLIESGRIIEFLSNEVEGVI